MGDSLGFKRLQNSRARRTEFMRVNSEQKQMVTVPRGLGGARLRMDSWNAAQSRCEIPSVLVASPRLFLEAVQLRVEDRAWNSPSR